MDVLIKNITNMTEQEVIDWVAIAVKRREEQKLTPPPAHIEAARTTIDSFRVANGLKAEFAKEEVKPAEEVKVEEKFVESVEEPVVETPADPVVEEAVVRG